MDEMIVVDGPAGRWMTIPLAPEEVGILQGLPEKGKHEFTENVHRYIGQVGDDYKVTPPDAVPAQEPAGIDIPFVSAGNKWVMHEDEGVGMTEEEMERVISVLKALPGIHIEEVLRSSTSYSEGEKR